MKGSAVILIVEDKQEYAEGLKRALEREIGDLIFLRKDRDFAHALDDLQLPPDVFIIDLYEDDYTPDAKQTGPELCQNIWKKRFRPMIVNSAFDVDPHVDHRIAKHPFYKYIKKGPSFDDVVDQVKTFIAHAAEVRKIEDEVYAALQPVVQDSAETIWRVLKDGKARSEALMRSARRRVGAMMDLRQVLSDETVLPWEQYIVPPLESDLLMADVLVAEDGKTDDALSYRVVLTPSCDLVLRNGKAKVKALLVGKCVDAKAFCKGMGLKSGNAEQLKKQLVPILTQAQINGYCPLPAYPGMWPEMAIKLRDTEFVAFDAISKPQAKAQFKRVASIDSPFREQIAWAHMQIASRPALPDRNVEPWADSIVAAVNK
jgi:DNA-binding NarL/FixJ family response regulator